VTPAEFLREFHVKFGEDPGPLRVELLLEESLEAADALEIGDRAEIAKELADVVYVCYGTALVYGIDLDSALAAVHESNMKKEANPGGKHIKPEGWQPPDMSVALGER
jgi:predicted HAD superfamily Cof-like phosphohydrolase